MKEITLVSIADCLGKVGNKLTILTLYATSYSLKFTSLALFHSSEAIKFLGESVYGKVEPNKGLFQKSGLGREPGRTDVGKATSDSSEVDQPDISKSDSLEHQADESVKTIDSMFKEVLLKENETPPRTKRGSSPRSAEADKG